MSRRLFHVMVCLLAFGVTAVLAAEGHSTNSTAEADIKKFQVAPGLKVELVAAEPLLQNPVCFSIDERGRFYVVETHRYRNAIFDITANTPWLLDDLSFRTVNDRAAFLARAFPTNFAMLTNDSEVIRLLDDKDHDGRAETSLLFADGFNKAVAGTAAGVLAQGTNVWFTCIPDLWRLPHSTQNSKPEARNNLATGLGVHISVSGHDVHGLIRGHDGRVYFSFGDRGVCVTNREGEILNVPDTGGVLRCEPDGRNLEVFCIGLRNPQELAFDDYGNLWTVDNDTAGADPCRVLHVIEGGDYGWRASYQHMKGFGPWVQEELWRGGLDGILPPAGAVSQGPAGLAFYPGTSAAPQLAGRFVHADFPGGVWAYSVKPRGASYELAEKEKILWNCWPTDVDFGPDGALYVLDWVQGWTPPGKGRIYRLKGSAELEARGAELIAEVRSLLADGMTRRSEKDLIELLGHDDRRVRLEAQWELVKRGTNSLNGLTAAANRVGNQMRRIHSLWATRQIVSELPMTEAAAELASLMPLLEDKDAEIRGQVALTLGEGQLFNAEKPMATLLEDPSQRVRLLAVQAYTGRWQGEFGPTGRRKRPRTYFSRYQKTVGPIANGVARAIGVDPYDAQKAVGTVITGRFPAPELNRLLPEYVAEPFVFGASVNFLFRTRRSTAVESHFANSPSVGSALGLLLAYRRAGNPAVKAFFTNSDPRIVLAAARAINDEPIAEGYPALATMLDDIRFRDANWGWLALSNITPAGPFSAKVRPPRDQVLLRALNAHYRLGEAKDADALVRFSIGVRPSPGAATQESPSALKQRQASDRPDDAAPDDRRTPGSLRAEALFLLSMWEVLPAKVGDLPIKPAKDPNHGSVPTVNPENWPGWFDRVVGLYRPLPPRPPDDARRALAPHIVALLSDSAPEVAQAALDAAAKLRLTNAAPALVARLKDPGTPPTVRRQIPSTLATMDVEELGDAVKLALVDADTDVRAAALPHLGRMRGDEAVRILGGIVEAGIAKGSNSSSSSTRLTQAALRALGDSKSSGANFILRTALTNLLAGKLPSELELDLLDAASHRTDLEIKSLLAQCQTRLPKDDPLAAWRPVLRGGDGERGRKTFFDKVEVQCSRCHIVKGQGGTVGPALDSIGKRQTREYLLESILFPSRSIASGFENVTVTLRSGAMHAGLVKGEDDQELRLESPEDGTLRLAKSEIVTRQRGLSAMPEGLIEFLSKSEIRDLVEFLSQLK